MNYFQDIMEQLEATLCDAHVWAYYSHTRSA